MTNLTNDSLGKIFTISAHDWTVINIRIADIKGGAQICGNFMTDLPGFSALLKSALLWESETFYGLIDMSKSVANYASTAVTDFGNLNKLIKEMIKSKSAMTEEVEQQSINLLKKLSDDTTSMSTKMTKLSDQVLAFLNDNKEIDAKVLSSKEKFAGLKAAIESYDAAVENAAGLITSGWRALSDDFAINPIKTMKKITLSYIESLNIDAAIVLWKKLQQEASAFPAMVDGQDKYWAMTGELII